WLYPRNAARRVDVEDSVEVLRAVDHQPRADRLAGQRRAAAAGDDRHLQLGCDLDGGDEVVPGPGDHDAQRHDLVDAGVGRVTAAGGVVEPDLAPEVAAEGPGQGVALDRGKVPHGGILGRRGKAD